MPTRRSAADYPGVQFPLEAYEQFMKQGVPRWVTTDEQIVAAYIELVDKVCPCVVLVHSQGGAFGFKVAEARPDKVKALVAVEPSAAGNIDEGRRRSRTCRSLMIYGDNAKEHPRWGKIRQNVHRLRATPSRRPAAASTVIDLPDIGIKGNTHMLMMDKNSDRGRRGDPEMAGRQRACRLMRRSNAARCTNLAANILVPAAIVAPRRLGSMIRSSL